MPDAEKEKGSWPSENLPSSWEWVPFESVYKNVTSSKRKLKQKQYLPEGTIPVVDQGKDLIGGYTEDGNLLHESELPLIIFGDHTRCVKFIDFNFAQGADGVKVLRPTELYSPKFSHRALQAVTLPDKGYSRHFKFLKATRFPLPPSNEQKRIADKIETLQGKSKKAKKALETAKPLLDKLRQSILASAFRGDMTADWRKKNPDVEPASVLLERIRVERRKKWEENELAKMRAKGKEPKNDKWKSKYKEPKPVDTNGLSELHQGWCFVSTESLFCFVTSGSRGWAKYYSQKGDIFLRIGNMDRRSINLDLRKVQFVLPQKGAEGIRTQVKKRDILVSITADIGVISIIPDNFPIAYINQHISLARPVDVISAKYLAWYLSSIEGQTQFQELKRGATKAGLGLDDIRSVIVPLPTIREQKEIVKLVEEKYRSIQKIEKRINRSLEKTEDLGQSILVKAFKGEIVPQNSSDESASALLEKIKGFKKNRCHQKRF